MAVGLCGIRTGIAEEGSGVVVPGEVPVMVDFRMFLVDHDDTLDPQVDPPPLGNHPGTTILKHSFMLVPSTQQTSRIPAPKSRPPTDQHPHEVQAATPHQSTRIRGLQHDLTRPTVRRELGNRCCMMCSQTMVVELVHTRSTRGPPSHDLNAITRPVRIVRGSWGTE